MDESESVSYSEQHSYEPHEIIGSSSFAWIHPDEVEAAKQLHYDTIKYDKAAAIAYLRVMNQEKRYVPCVIQRSMAHNALIGSISFAKPGAKALHTAATAQEVTFLTPSLSYMQFEFRKWNDPTPRRTPTLLTVQKGPDPALFSELPTPEERTGFILDRFSAKCPVWVCTNDCFIPTERVLKRSFFDFVVPEDEAIVRRWIEVSKGWGVSDTGLPSDGGFVWCGFRMCLQGRHSGEGTRVRRRRGSVPNADPNDILAVDAVFTAHSDGFIVVVRRAGSGEQPG
ncbi:hypothetical protein BU17DRAFT_73932 [Hysterangium stoloniferum]|nr:hypothetical protein BU17DRAFT_73932 [Hysterangium stoloniferum]